MDAQITLEITRIYFVKSPGTGHYQFRGFIINMDSFFESALNILNLNLRNTDLTSTTLSLIK
jgi:hypothetical protein